MFHFFPKKTPHTGNSRGENLYNAQRVHVRKALNPGKAQLPPDPAALAASADRPGPCDFFAADSCLPVRTMTILFPDTDKFTPTPALAAQLAEIRHA
jgi:hypothetical protein